MRGVIFFIKTRVCVHEKGIFSLARAEPALAKRVSWQGGAREKMTFFVRRARGAPAVSGSLALQPPSPIGPAGARQAGLETKSDLWAICIQEIKARAAESVRSARYAL